MTSWYKTSAIAGAAILLAVVGWKLTRSNPAAYPIVADGAEQVIVLPFSTLTSFSELPKGWGHRILWATAPMMLSYEEKDGVQALRCETNGSGSILSRSTDIEMGDYPVLEWDWRIESPIESAFDEDTEAGDDHPARLLLKMEDRQGSEYAFEIVWGNVKFSMGDYFYIGETAHYVANGREENTRQWQHQEVDLMEVYREVTGRDDYPILKSIAVFCDSDNTGVRSVAYLTDVVMRQR